MELKKTWQKVQNSLFLRDLSSNVDALENVVYTIERDPQSGELFLTKIAEKFDFDFKVYGLETDFIRRSMKTYNATNGNMGILMNGVKGTGKTITSEIIANEANQPVLLIHTPWGGINTFLSSIPQNLTILIDEYEKVYKGNIGEGDWNDDDETKAGADSSLLSLMDGTFKTKWRKLFLLTTNRTWINDNMLNRPGRIRYQKDFGDLNLEQINEILDDCLVQKEFREDIIDYIKPLKIITVDIVKAIVSEVNIHQEKPEVCCKDLNVEFKDDTYSVFKIEPAKDDKKEKETVMSEEVSIQTFESFKKRMEGGNFRNAVLSADNLYIMGHSKHEHGKDVYKVWDANTGQNDKPFLIRFKKNTSYHKAFAI